MYIIQYYTEEDPEEKTLFQKVRGWNRTQPCSPGLNHLLSIGSSSNNDQTLSNSCWSGKKRKTFRQHSEQNILERKNILKDKNPKEVKEFRFYRSIKEEKLKIENATNRLFQNPFPFSIIQRISKNSEFYGINSKTLRFTRFKSKQCEKDSVTKNHNFWVNCHWNNQNLVLLFGMITYHS